MQGATPHTIQRWMCHIVHEDHIDDALNLEVINVHVCLQIKEKQLQHVHVLKPFCI